MSFSNKIPREFRRQTLVASAAQKVFGPSNFKIYDPLDVSLFRAAPGAAGFTLVDRSEFTVALVGAAPSVFTVTFHDGQELAARVRLDGRRTPERQTDVTQGGVVRAVPLETELDRQTIVGQEARRDLDDHEKRGIFVPDGETGFTLPPILQRNLRYIRFDLDGKLELVPGAPAGISQQLIDIINAKANIVHAHSMQDVLGLPENLQETDIRLDQLEAGASGLVFSTAAQANANLAYPILTRATVVADPGGDDVNGVYQKQGASGTGSWLRLGPLGTEILDDKIDDLSDALNSDEPFPTPPPRFYSFHDGSGFSLLRTDNVLFVIPILGQSNAMGATGGAIISTTPVYPGRALMPKAGVRVDNQRTPALVNLVEADTIGVLWETAASSLCNHLIRDLDAKGLTGSRFCSFVSAIGSTPYEGLKRGSLAYYRIQAQLADIVALAARDGMRVVVPAFIWIGSENNTFFTQQERHTAMMLQLQREFSTDCRQITGQVDEPLLFLSQVNRVQESKGLEQPIQMSAIEAARSPYIRNVGPIYQCPRADVVHLSSLGQHRLGQMFARAIAAECFGTGWASFAPRDVYFITGSLIRVDCHVPVAPAVLDLSGADITLAGMRGKYGFDVQSLTGFETIDSVSIFDGRAIQLQLASPPAGPWVRVAYAMRRDDPDDNTGIDGPVHGARGCIRDSDDHVSIYDGHVSRNWMCAWQARIPTV